MSARDLYETIKTWLNIYRDITRPDAEPGEFRKKYEKGMLKVVSALYIAAEIENTPIEKHLRKAIEDAKTGDFTKLDEICVFLNEVERYMHDRNLN